MRQRVVSTTVSPSTNKTSFDYISNVSTNQGPNSPYVDYMSLMWDDPTGGRGFKPVTHLSYVATINQRHQHDSGDTSNYPNPRTRLDGYVGLQYRGQMIPTNYTLVPHSYIPVTAATSDDIGNCVFNAYNKFVTGVSALDASVSIAELGETPGLFRLWQRRLGAPANLVNGFLNYSFGWKPLYRDFMAIKQELSRFPQTVRKRLKAMGQGDVVRHFKFTLSDTIPTRNVVLGSGVRGPQPWQSYHRDERTVNKSRVVVVTIRANVKPKLGPEGQAILDKLGALGLIPSLATLWSITRLSFVFDWFYNIGGAIENLQGSLTHTISNVRVCVSDARSHTIETRCEDLGGSPQAYATEELRYYNRYATTVPNFPVVRVPRRPMQYVLLGLLTLTNTQAGRSALSKIDKLDKYTPNQVRKLRKEITILTKALLPGFGKKKP